MLRFGSLWGATTTAQEKTLHFSERNAAARDSYKKSLQQRVCKPTKRIIWKTKCDDNSAVFSFLASLPKLPKPCSLNQPSHTWSPNASTGSGRISHLKESARSCPSLRSWPAHAYRETHKRFFFCKHTALVKRFSSLNLIKEKCLKVIKHVWLPASFNGTSQCSKL